MESSDHWAQGEDILVTLELAQFGKAGYSRQKRGQRRIRDNSMMNVLWMVSHGREEDK